MNISEKIQSIRNKPEHIRLRYVWGSVLVCMLIVFAIWIFSITVMFQKNIPDNKQPDANLQDLQNNIKQLGDTAPSLKNIDDQPLDVPTNSPAENNSASAGTASSAVGY